VSPVTVNRSGNAVRFQVRLQPRASRNEIAGVLDGALRVRVHAPPVDGAANDALIALLADRLAVPRRGVRIVTGATSRTKTIEVDGVTPADVERLTGASSGDSDR
jgi:uncharacterized protein (TIGR00251 family)